MKKIGYFLSVLILILAFNQKVNANDLICDKPEVECLKENVNVTSKFGERWGSFHTGSDYGLRCGTEVFSAAAGSRLPAFGRVIEVGTEGQSLGNQSTPSTPSNYIKIQHDSELEDGRVIETWYWHLQDVYVQVGDIIESDTPIGTVGNTGYVRGNPDAPLEQQGCHLHFEVRIIENEESYPIDPELLLKLWDDYSPLYDNNVQGIGQSFNEVFLVSPPCIFVNSITQTNSMRVHQEDEFGSFGKAVDLNIECQNHRENGDALASISGKISFAVDSYGGKYVDITREDGLMVRGVHYSSFFKENVEDGYIEAGKK